MSLQRRGMPAVVVKSEAWDEETEAEYRDLFGYYMVPRSTNPQGEYRRKRGNYGHCYGYYYY